MTDDDAAASRRSRYLRWLGYLRPFRGMLLLAILCLCAGMTVDVVLPRIVGYIIDHMLSPSAMAAGAITLPIAGRLSLQAAFLATLGCLLVLLALRSGSHYLRNLQLAQVGEQVHLRIRQDLFDHLQRLPISYFDTSYTGRIMARITTDADALWQLLYNGVIEIVGQSVLIVVVLCILLRIHAGLTLFSLLMLPLLLYYSYHTRRRAGQIGKAQREAVATIFSRLQERISGIRLIRIFNRGTAESTAFSEDLRQLHDHNLALTTAYSGLWVKSEFITGAVGAAILCFGAIAVLHWSMSIGNLVTFYLYSGMLLSPLALIIRAVTEHVTNADVAMERIFGLLDTPVAEEYRNAGRPCPRLQGQLTLEHVTFAYRSGHPVLQDISVDIRPGETVALVGPSGAGKSTLVNLLCRFYQPAEGRILADGGDIADYDVESFRRQISFVAQDHFLFSGTVAENLAFAKPDASMEEIQAAARRANAHDFIMRLPHGYQTEVGERGVLLSGGQKQRLTLARALLRDPAILILDEPTSALDAESEALILEALESMFRGKTCLLIAHRLSTILSADTILVLDNGRIVQRGTHTELAAVPGIYRELCLKQFIDVEAGDAPREPVRG